MSSAFYYKLKHADSWKKIKDGGFSHYNVPQADFENNSLLKVYDHKGNIDKYTIKISIFIFSFLGFCI